MRTSRATVRCDPAPVDPDADRRFLRLAAAITADAGPEDVPGLDVDVRGRTFAHRTRDADGRRVDVRVAVLPSALVVRPGLGPIASEAWGEELSDEEAWFRFTLVAWDEDLATTDGVGSGWWTFDGGTVVPVPPWEARGWTPPPEDPLPPRPRRRRRGR